MLNPSIIRISDLPLREQCHSSHIREMEYLHFIKHHELDIDVVKEVDRHYTNERGMRLANVLVRLPYHLPDIGISAGSSFNIDLEIKQACMAENVTLKNGDLAFIHSTLAKRDSAIRKFAGRHNGKLTEIICNQNASMRMFCTLFYPSDGAAVPVTLKGTPAFWIEARTSRGNYHTLILDFTTNYAPETEDGKPHAGIRGLAVLASSEHKRTRSVSIAQLASGEIAPDAIRMHYFDEQDIEAAETNIRRFVSRIGIDVQNYRTSADAEGTPGKVASEQLDADAQTGDHCIECPGAACCGRARKTAEEYAREVSAAAVTPLMKRMRDDLKILGNTMNTNTLLHVMDTTKTLTDMLSLPEKLWKDSANLARALEAKKTGSVQGWLMKPGANRVVLANEDATPEDIYNTLKPVLGGLAFDEFVRRACSVRPSAIEALVGDVEKIPPSLVLDSVLKPILGRKNPLMRKANAPTVVRNPVYASEKAKVASLPEARPASKGGCKKA
jgi:hypothetical protein